MSQHVFVQEAIVHATNYHACGCHIDGSKKQIYEHQASRKHINDMPAQDLMATCETFTWIATNIHNRTMSTETKTELHINSGLETHGQLRHLEQKGILYVWSALTYQNGCMINNNVGPNLIKVDGPARLLVI